MIIQNLQEIHKEEKKHDDKGSCRVASARMAHDNSPNHTHEEVSRGGASDRKLHDDRQGLTDSVDHPDVLPPGMARARRRRKALAADEVEILRYLYEYRALNVDLLSSILYSDTGEADVRRTYRRLARLRDLGHVRPYDKIPSSARGGGSVYAITDVGIRALWERGLIEQKRRAQDNRVSYRQLAYILEVNRAAIDLNRSGWVFEQGRDVKAAHGLNRGDPIAGRLSSPDGRRYAVYYMTASPKGRTIVTVISQMKTIAGAVASNVVFFVGGIHAFQWVVKEARKQGVLIGGEMLVLPYKYGIRYLTHVSTVQKEREYIERILGGSVKASRHPWFRYETEAGEVVIPFINHDLMGIEALRRWSGAAVVIILDKMLSYLTDDIEEVLKRPGVQVVQVSEEVFR